MGEEELRKSNPFRPVNNVEKIDPALTASLEKVQKQKDVVCGITTYNGLNTISDLKCYLSYLQQIEKVFPVTGKKVPSGCSLHT